MNDISALVLTLGEESTKEVIDSLYEQTILPVEIIVVENVLPFHKAFNSGISRVKTDFFIQVDSDMILDIDCLKYLRRCMNNNIGIVCGYLRDPLSIKVCCIKMYRTKCFESLKFMDSISPDTDFREKNERNGWHTIHALNFNRHTRTEWHTFGDHRPSYTPLYTYSKYLLEGKRYIYNQSLDGFKRRLTKLKNSCHKNSLIAEIALVNGVFLKEQNDLLRPYLGDEGFKFLKKFMTSKDNYNINEFYSFSIKKLKTIELFEKFYRYGIELRNAKSFSAFKHYVDILNKNNDENAWIAIAGICRGVFFDKFDRSIFVIDYQIINALIRM